MISPVPLLPYNSTPETVDFANTKKTMFEVYALNRALVLDELWFGLDGFRILQNYIIPKDKIKINEDGKHNWKLV